MLHLSASRRCCGTVVSNPTAVVDPCLHGLQKSAATNSASPLLSAIVDCFRLDAMIGYQPSFPRNHDAVPLTLNRSASLAQSESQYVNTEPTGALFTASRLSVVGRTIIIPGFPRRYRGTDLFSSCPYRSHVPGLMRPFPSHSVGPLYRSIAIFQPAFDTLIVCLEEALARLFHDVPISVFFWSFLEQTCCTPPACLPHTKCRLRNCTPPLSLPGFVPRNVLVLLTPHCS